MAKTGRKAFSDKPEHWKIAIPTSIAAPVSLLLADPLTGRPKHGERGRLISRLLSEWLETQKKSGIQLAPEE